MKKIMRAAMIGVFTVSSLFINLSYAQGPGDGPDWSRHQQQDRQDDRGGDRHFHGHGHDDRGDRGERNHFTWRGDDFRRGHPAPPRYRGNDYRVYDWRERGLDMPPRGAHWAYVDGNYVLIAAATGVITAIIIGNLLGQH
ncbi:RcnB family protein [Erwinia tasmaniensis]|nr:RcnB family protein [Erwinia tasmaniensis]